MIITVVLLVGCGALAVWAPYQREQQLIAEFERLSGETETEVVRPVWIPGAVDDEYLELFKRVRIIDLCNTAVDDAGLERLREAISVANLKELRLDDVQISDAGLKQIQDLKNLSVLWLDVPQISDTGLGHIGKMSHLKALSLNNTGISDAGLQHLRGLRNLETLSLNDTKISDQGLEHLRGLSDLELLFVRKSDVTRAGVEKLQKALPGCRIVWETSPK